MQPHELIEKYYPGISEYISPLASLVKINPELIDMALEVAVVIGIYAVHKKLESDKRNEILQYIRDITSESVESNR